MTTITTRRGVDQLRSFAPFEAFGWLVVGWLVVGWLVVGRLVCWLVCPLEGWLVGRLVGWLVGRL